MGTGTLSLEQLSDPNALNAYLQKAGWQSVIVGIITAYPYIALSVKRRHDRNSNGYDAIGLIVLGIVYSLLQALGVMASGGTVFMIVGLVFAVYAIYMLVQLGFLKGTVGPNSYGPDPLQG